MGSAASISDARDVDQAELFREVVGPAAFATRTVVFPSEGLSFVARADEVRPELPSQSWLDAVPLAGADAPTLGAEYTLALWVKLGDAGAVPSSNKNNNDDDEDDAAWTALFTGTASEVLLGRVHGQRLGVASKGAQRCNVALNGAMPWSAPTAIVRGSSDISLDAAADEWALVFACGRSRRKRITDFFVASDRRQLRRVGRVPVCCAGSTLGAIGAKGVAVSRAYVWANRCLSQSEMRAAFICEAAEYGALSAEEARGVQFGGFWAPVKSASEAERLRAAVAMDGVLDLTGTGASDDDMRALLATARLGAADGVHTVVLAGCPISDRGLRIGLLPLLREARYLRSVDVTGCAHVGATIEAELLAVFPLERGVAMRAAGTALSIRAIEKLANSTRAARHAQKALVLELAVEAATLNAGAAATAAVESAAANARGATRAADSASRAAAVELAAAAKSAVLAADAAVEASLALVAMTDRAVAMVVAARDARRSVVARHAAKRVDRAVSDACAVSSVACVVAREKYDECMVHVTKLVRKRGWLRSLRSVGRRTSMVQTFKEAWKEELDVTMHRWMGDKYPYISTSFVSGTIKLNTPLEFLKNSATPEDAPLFDEVGGLDCVFLLRVCGINRPQLFFTSSPLFWTPPPLPSSLRSPFFRSYGS